MRNVSHAGLLKPEPREYLLEDVPELNLPRDQFPYGSAPRILFDGVSVPMNLPEDFFITDTTFRDGQQACPPYEVHQIVALYDRLHRLARGYEFSEVTGWIRARAGNFRLVREMGLKETGILTSASDYHSIWNRVEEQYVQGRTTGISDAEMLTQAKQHLPEFFRA